MTRFLVRRLLLTIPVLLGIVFVVFVLARVIPGDPCVAALGERATDAICNDFNARYGLNEPIPVQFVLYLQDLAQGDLGTSIRFNRPVADLLLERLPLTVELALSALLIAVIVGIPLGLISALRRNSAVDVGTMLVANLGVSIPVFVLGLLLQFLFAVVLRDTFLALPPSGRTVAGAPLVPLAEAWGLQDLGGLPRGLLDFFSNMYFINYLLRFEWERLIDAFRHMILPAIALSTIPMAIIARITRSSLVDVMGHDYVRTARAKGLSGALVIRRHAMRNAMLPVVTIIGLQLGALLSGAVLTETIFNLTGVGRTLYEAIIGRDYIVVQGFTLIIAIGYVLANLIVDISYAFLDPRIRLS